MPIDVFVEFFKIGCVAVGGGYTVIPFLYYLIPVYHWYEAETITEMIAVSNVTPGPIGINMATYAGFQAGGFLGAVLATVAVVLPSIIIVPILSKILKKYKNNCFTEYVMYGLRPAAVALITVAALQIFKSSILTIDKFASTHRVSDLVSLKAVCMLCFFAVCGYFLRKRPMLLILLGAIAGVFVYFIEKIL